MSEVVRNYNSMALVLASVVLTSCSQLIVKWRVLRAGQLPIDLTQKFLFFDPWIITGILAAFFAGLSWMAAMTKLQLSFAYPFMSLSFVLVFVFSALLFHETISAPKVVGMLLIIAGIFVIGRG